MLDEEVVASLAGGSVRLESAGDTRLQRLRQHAKFPLTGPSLQGKNAEIAQIPRSAQNESPA
jgi:hypothetical protein